MKESIKIILQTASVDALARLRSSSAMCDEETKDAAFNIYFDQQNHFSLIDYLQNNLSNVFDGGATIQVYFNIKDMLSYIIMSFNNRLLLLDLC